MATSTSTWAKKSPDIDGKLFVSKDMLFLEVDLGPHSDIFQVKPSHTKDPSSAIDPDGNLYHLDHVRVMAFPLGRKTKNVKLHKEVPAALREEGVLYLLTRHSLAFPYEIK
ncbi:MAG: hypothetical protein GU344_02300 [Thermocrinis sp.]|jgi:hypothetical protein|nr:hypothetical protein [Thermocrinis sp.]